MNLRTVEKVTYFILGVFFIGVVYAQSSSVSLEPLDNGLRTSIVGMTNSAAAIPSVAFSGRKSLIIKNLDTTNTVYVGTDTVTADETSTGGFPLGYYETFPADIGENTAVYGRMAGTQTGNVSIMEVR